MRQPGNVSDDDSRSTSGAGSGAARFDSTSTLSGTSVDDGFLDNAVDLACPACGADLMEDDHFLVFRVCGQCNRHFSIPARERIIVTVDPGSFAELAVDAGARVSGRAIPVGNRLEEYHDPRSIEDAVVTGIARTGGAETMIVALDDHLVGASIGAMMAEKMIVAFELAHARRIPVVVMCAGGSARTTPGPLEVVQSGRLATAAAKLHMDGILIVAILAHPTSGWIYRALASHGDLIFAEPGARIGIGERPDGDLPGSRSCSAESLVPGGWVDEIVDRTAIRGKLTTLFTTLTFRGFARAGSQPPGNNGVGPASWRALAQLHDQDRPDGASYLSSLVSSITPLRGDRVAGDDPGTVCGVGRFDSVTVAFVSLDRPRSGDAERSEAVVARKIMRLAKLAGRLELPVLVLIGGDPAAPAIPTTIESAQAVTSLSAVLAMLPVPIVSVAIGEVRGSLATSLLGGDRRFMQDNAVLTAEAGPAQRPVRQLGPVPYPLQPPERGNFLTARECLRLGLIDAVIEEGADGARADPPGAAAAVRAAVLMALAELAATGQRRLLETRHQRQRSLGQSTPEGLAAARSELWDYQEWQHSLTKSIDEWRGRWKQRRRTSPRLPLHRPDLAAVADLADRLRARRAGMLDRAGRGDRSDT